MNKQLMKGILMEAMGEAMTEAGEKHTKNIATLMLKDAGDVCAGSIDVLIVNQCREYEDVVERIKKNFDIATALINQQ